MSGIGIRSGRIWGISRRMLVMALGDLYSDVDPTIIFDLTQPKNNIMINKVLMNQKLDKLGIHHPKSYYYPFEDLPNTEEECVIKGKYGSRGNHLVFTTFDKINNYPLYDKYIQHYVPFTREFRVGIFDDKVLGIREKLLNDECECKKIKNSKSCYYETRDIPKLRKFALKVFKKFDIDFTGMDIGVCNKNYIVIELNSSPTIGEYWAKLITRILIEKLEEL